MKSSILLLLHSEKPSQRSLAIDHLRKEATVDDIGLLREAMQVETVPTLHRHLSRLVRELRRPVETKLLDTASPETAGERRRFEDDVVHWMRHELEPGIGWLMLAASDEVEDFCNSETHSAIDGLNRRIDSIEALVRASAPPRYEVLSLSEVVQEAVKISRADMQRLAIDLEIERNDEITTDANLLRLVLSNAIRNAVDAVLEDPDSNSQVYVSADVAPSTFWVKVSNQFAGSEFSLDDVSGKGVTAKIGHQGQGFGIMRIVAARLGYELLMQAEAGLAIFTLRGKRKSD